MTGEIRPLNPETGKAHQETVGNRGVLQNLVACVEKIRLRIADACLSRIRSEIP
jgi:cell division ATPase FtsA